VSAKKDALAIVHPDERLEQREGWLVMLGPGGEVTSFRRVVVVSGNTRGEIVDVTAHTHEYMLTDSEAADLDAKIVQTVLRVLNRGAVFGPRLLSGPIGEMAT
jgi:hypothetical protein